MIFYYETLKDADDPKPSIVEKKILTFKSNNDEEAYKEATSKGYDEQFSFSDDGIDYNYKFLGINELISLEGEDNDVVWWEYIEMIMPSDREKLVPDRKRLRLFAPLSSKGKATLLKK